MRLSATMITSLLLVSLASVAGAAPCDSLATLALPHTKIAVAKLVDTGTFAVPADAVPIVAPGGPGPGTEFKGLPPFCRVAASIAPSSDSDIRIEVWLPRDGWNGKFMAVGNGGWSGAISYAAMVAVLKRGYAVASTDTGHQSSGADARWAMGHPEKQIDFGYRAVHEMTLRAKEIVDAFYGKTPARSYWNGCSSGGKQGLKEAQQFPTDYDGIIAGAPANYWTHLGGQILSLAQVARRGGAPVIPETKYPLIHDAVLQQCDVLDGVRDGLLEDPRRCTFDPASLACQEHDAATCLTAPEIAALKAAYAPVRNAAGEVVFPGLERGGEPTWGNLPQPFPIADSHFKYIVEADPNWDYLTFRLETDLPRADEVDRSVGHFNAIDPDLTAFKHHGGKLLQYHGWSDQTIAPENSINYYESVISKMGGSGAVEPFYRLFMVPGMAHCRGGDGPDQFDTIGALEQWVEHGTPPDRIIAARMKSGAVVRSRPLCPYPLVAQWTGTGSTDEEKNFQCVADTKR